jgi:hypothetical protein
MASLMSMAGGDLGNLFQGSGAGSWAGNIN